MSDSDDEREYFYFAGLQRRAAYVHRALSEEGWMNTGEHELFETLVGLRQKMGMIINRPLTQFQAESSIVDLSDLVDVVLDMLRASGDCHLKWFIYLTHTDLIDMLLRVAAVAKRENDNEGSGDAWAIRQAVALILPEKILQEYIHVGNVKEGGEESIIAMWEEMLRNVAADYSRRPQPRDLYRISGALGAHWRSYHKCRGVYSCIEMCVFGGLMEELLENEDFVSVVDNEIFRPPAADDDDDDDDDAGMSGGNED
jgi:hypothetical protein